MDEKELQAVAEALDQLRQGGTVSAETLSKLGGTAQNVNKALEGYTKKILGATSAIGGMARQVSDGEGSFKSLGGAIGGLTSVVGKLASALPLVGGAAKALAEGVGEAAKFVLDQLDTMAKNYQTLGDASAGAADGVDGLLRQFNNMGNFSLPAFTRAVRANVQGLAALSGTAGLGAEELAKVSGVLTTGDTARKFLKLGIGLDSVGDATAEYLANMSRYGLTQGLTTVELTKKTQDYIVEVDKIARLTGQTREAQAKEAQKSLADSRFRAKLAEMRANGQRQQAEELQKYVDGLGGALGDAARATVTGTYLTQQSAEADVVLNGAIRRNIDAIEAGTKATDAIANTQDAAAQGAKQFGTLFKFGKDLGGVGKEIFDIEALLLRRNELEAEGLSRVDAIAKAQQEQMEASGKTTQELTDAQLATAGASKQLQSLGFSLATYAVPAVNKFAGALERVTGYVNEKFGVGGTISTPAGVSRGAPGGPRAGGGAAGGVNPQLASAVQSAMNDYTAMTGKTATITSTVRSRAQQQALYDAYIAGGKKGMPVAPPGSSRHELGNAVDINRAAADEMDRMGILSKYGLARPVANDPVHIELAGPRGGRRNTMSDVNYNSAGAATQAQGQQGQVQQEEKNSVMGMMQVMQRIEYNTRNGAREQQKTNRVLQ